MTQKLKSIMFVGTASDVGKSIITTGVCRIFKQDGYHPAPFKAQNMSLNSFATSDGFEIGRAQAVQAEACGIACLTDMNPILLKPTNDRHSQVVLHGKPIGTQSAYEYFMGNEKQHLFKEATAAYDRLEARYNPIVLEGAGSISELNLKKRDITNMRMAQHASADTYLIADIDKGGIFGSVFGTVALLTPEEKSRLKGIIINKFRGDLKLFEEGKTKLEALCDLPVVGIVPYFKGIQIDEEDSVGLQFKNRKWSDHKVNVGVVLLKRLSNFTDFSKLENDDRIHLFYSDRPEELEKADVLIIPGSKNTIEDLIELKNNGIGKTLINAFKNNKKIIGICGGFQMMGHTVEDPHHVEGKIELMYGLGILPIKTILTQEKITRQRKFYFKSHLQICEGYEIHMGITEELGGEKNSLNTYESGTGEGYILNDRCWGTYLHGILDNAIVIDDLLNGFQLNTKTLPEDYTNFKDRQYDLLADHLRQHLDIEFIYRNLKN